MLSTEILVDEEEVTDGEEEPPKTYFEGGQALPPEIAASFEGLEFDDLADICSLESWEGLLSEEDRDELRALPGHEAGQTPSAGGCGPVTFAPATPATA